MEDGDSLDSVRIKAVFYALYFGTDRLSLRSAAAKDFVDCFVEYEERVRIITVLDEEGKEIEIEESYVVMFASTRPSILNVLLDVSRFLS